jgi:hypothetical protein
MIIMMMMITLVKNLEGNCVLGTSGHSLEDNIKMDFKYIELESVK